MMGIAERTKWVLPLLLFSTNCGALCAQQSVCPEVAITADMARASSSASLMRMKSKSGSSYRLQAVYAARQFELMPKSKAAAALLLDLIPRNPDQQDVWMEMNSSLCDGESMRDLRTLAVLKSRLASDLASAVLLVPEKMQLYVNYASEAVQDPESDYALQMKRVCRRDHAAFTQAVDVLGDGRPENDAFGAAGSAWFKSHILNPDRCRALAPPEAEW